MESVAYAQKKSLLSIRGISETKAERLLAEGKKKMDNFQDSIHENIISFQIGKFRIYNSYRHS